MRYSRGNERFEFNLELGLMTENVLEPGYKMLKWTPIDDYTIHSE